MWWDNETDGDAHVPGEVEAVEAGGSGSRRWCGIPRRRRCAATGRTRSSCATSRDLNASNKQTQFADFNGHGWIYRAVFKHDRKGNWLDKDDAKVDFNDPQKFDKAVHLSDIHLEKGMHCVDCHFEQDSHGNGHLYGEPRAAVEIDCADCHGTIARAGDAEDVGHRGARGRDGPCDAADPVGARRFEWVEGKLMQRSMVDAECRVEGLAGARLDHAGFAELQREGALREDQGRSTWGAQRGTLAHATRRCRATRATRRG